MKSSISNRTRYGLAYLQATVLTLLFSNMVWVPYVYAGPEGETVTGGSGTINRSDNTTTINQNSQNMAIDWQSYNVNSNEIVNYVQPNSSAMSLNRIMSNNGSKIYGQINANGHVILINPHGVTFAAGSIVNVGGIIASTLDMSPTDFMNGQYAFKEYIDDEGKVINGKVVNSGIINAAVGGNVALIGQQVQNDGLIMAKLGSVTLAAGKEAVLTFDNQGLVGVKVTKAVLQEEIGVEPGVLNSGEILADGGRVLLTASVSQDVFSQAVNTNGMEPATSVVVNADGTFTLGGGVDVVNTGTIDVSQANAGNANMQAAVDRYNDKHIIPAQNTETEQNTTIIKILDDGTLNTSADAKLNTLLANFNDVNDPATSTGGGRVAILGQNVMSSGDIKADATSGNGGEIELHAMDKTLLTENSMTSARSEANGVGGVVKVLGDKVGLFDQSTVDVSGANGGGQALIGGDKEGRNSKIRNSSYVYVGDGSQVKADALDIGDGGKVITFANNTTRIHGDLFARGGVNGGDGGFIETSGIRSLEITSIPDASSFVGANGEWLIDPSNVTIVNACAGDAGACIDATPISNPFLPGSDNTEIEVNIIEQALRGGNDVTIRTTNAGGTELGDISFEANMDFNGVDNNSLILEADNDITFVTGSSIQDLTLGSAGDRITLELYAGGDVSVESGVNISTSGGGVIVGTAANRVASFNSLSDINTYGPDSSSSILARNGGSINIYTTNDIGVTTLDAHGSTRSNNNGNGLSGGSVILDGRNVTVGVINTSGSNVQGNNNTGGTAGTITLDATNNVIVNGAITANGGNASQNNGNDGDAGSGALVDIGAGNDITINATASISSNGGNGADDDGNGGVGGGIVLAATNDELINGSLTSNGGDSGGDRGDGGVAGNILLTAGNDIDINQTLTSNGGGTGTRGGYTSGNAGEITLTAARNITVAANITGLGGTGSSPDGVGATILLGSAVGNYTNTFNINNGVSFLGESVTINGLDGNDTLVTGGTANDNTWWIDGAGAGLLANNADANDLNIRFNDMENLTGNTGQDDFFYTTTDAAITGVINGGGGSSDTLDIQILNTSRTVELGNRTTGNINVFQVETITANNTTTNTLLGDSDITNAIWTITDVGTGSDGTDDGTYAPTSGATAENTVTFINFDNLTGRAGIDNFRLSDSGNISGSINGGIGPGRNTLTASELVDAANATGWEIGNTWNFTGINAGSVVKNGDAASESGFTNIQEVTGGAGADTFQFTTTDARVDRVTGGDGTDSVEGHDLVNTWDVDGAYTGTLSNTATDGSTNLAPDNNKIRFSGIETLTGGTDNDTFQFTTATAKVDGLSGGNGTGVDVIEGHSLATDWNITGSNNGNFTNSAIDDPGTPLPAVETTQFSEIENITGADSVIDSFVYGAAGQWDGTLTGGIGAGDNINMTDATGVMTVIQGTVDPAIVATINTNIVGFEQITGNDTNNTASVLIGEIQTNDWEITASNGGTVTNSSSSAGTLSFSGFGNLTGRSGIDNFNLTLDGNIAGLMDGGAGASDTLTIASTGGLLATAPVIIQLGQTRDTSLNVDHVEDITANFGTLAINTLRGEDINSTWIVGDAVPTPGEGGYKGTVTETANNIEENTVAFTNINSIVGGSADDIFTLSGSYGGSIDAGGQTVADYLTVTGTFIVGSTLPGAITGIEGVAGDNTETSLIVGGGFANTWTITGTNTGRIDSTVSLLFTNFHNLEGAGGFVDTFNYDPDGLITGSITGGTGAGDTIDMSSATSTMTIIQGAVDPVGAPTENTNIVGIEQITANSATSSTLIGQNQTAATSWSVTAENDGTVTNSSSDGGSLSFIDFENLVGNEGDDNFSITGSGRVTGSLAGGDGRNTLTIDIDDGAPTPVALANTWTIQTNNYQGTVTAGISNGFTNIHEITGGAGSDTFRFATNTVLVDSINGGGGSDTLEGHNLANTWNISGQYSGTLSNSLSTGLVTQPTADVITFSGIETLAGNNNNDTFRFTTVTAKVDSLSGGDSSGNDSIEGHNLVTTWNITSDGGGEFWNSAIDIGVTPAIETTQFSQIEDITGGSANDEFVLFDDGQMAGTLSGGGGTNNQLTINNGANNAGDWEVANTWSITGNNSGSVEKNSAAASQTQFSGIQAINAADAADRFDIDGGFSGTINGGDGSDLFDITIVNTASLNGQGGSDTFDIRANSEQLNGGTGGDTFNLLAGGLIVTSVNGGFDPNPDNSNDSLNAFNESNYWRMTSLENGTVYRDSSMTGNSVEFREIEQLSGGSGSQQDTVDYRGLLGAGNVTVVLGTNLISGFDMVVGNNSNRLTLQASDSPNSWTIGEIQSLNDASFTTENNGVNDGDVNGIQFVDVRNITGGSGSDTFTIESTGSITGTINGGTVTDSTTYNTLVGRDVESRWEITAADSGRVDQINPLPTLPTRYVNRFESIQNLTGGAGADTFDLNVNGSVNGTINGGVVTDASNYNTLIASNNSQNNWAINDLDGGLIATKVGLFESIQNLTGGNNQDDNFVYTATGQISGLIDGAGQATASGDYVDMRAIPVNTAISLTLGTDITNIERLDGNGNANSQLTGTGTTNTWDITGINSGSVNSTNFTGFANLSGNGTSTDIFNYNGAGSLSGSIDGAGGDLDELNITNTGNSDVVVMIGDAVRPLADDPVYDNPPDRIFDFTTAEYIRVDGVENIDVTSITNTGEHLIVGRNDNNRWTITEDNRGNVVPSSLINVPSDQVISFNGFNHLRGGTSNDIFDIQSGTITGIIDGADHLLNGGDTISTNQANYSFTLGQDIVVGSLTIRNIEGVSATDGTMNARNGFDTTWNIAGADAGTVSNTDGDSLTFDGFSTLNGSDQIDVFNITQDGSISNIINGNDGDDQLNITLVDGDGDIGVNFDGGIGGNDIVTISGGTGANYLSTYTTNQISYTNDFNVNYSYDISYLNVVDVYDGMEANLAVMGTSSGDTITLGRGDAYSPIDPDVPELPWLRNTGTDLTSQQYYQVNSDTQVFYANKLNVTVDGGVAIDTIDVAADVNTAETLTLISETVTTSSGVINADTLALVNVATAPGTATNRLQVNIDNLEVINSADVFLDEQDGLALSQINSAGIVNIVSDGNITSNGLISNTSMVLNSTGEIQLRGNNQLSGQLNITAGTLTLENTVHSNLIGGDIDVLNISGTSANIVETNSLNIANANMSGLLSVESQGLEIGTINAANVDIDAGSGAVSGGGTINALGGTVDVRAEGIQFAAINANVVNLNSGAGAVSGGGSITAPERVSIVAGSGIGTGIDEGGNPLNVTTGELDVSNDASDTNNSVVNIRNTGDVLVSNLVNTGSMRFENVNGDVTVQHIDAGFGYNGHLNLRVANGSVYGYGPTPSYDPDISGYSGVIHVDGLFGTDVRPIVLQFNGSLQLYSQYSVISFLGQRPFPFTDNSDLTRILTQSTNFLTLIELESLAEIDPAIFTEVRNYYHEDLAIMMPSDQLYSDDEEEKRRKMSERTQ